VLAAAVFSAALAASAAETKAPELSAELGCEPALVPGRVLCKLEATARSDLLIAWADALVLEAPSFARPLRSRVAHRAATAREESVAIPLALYATRAERGTLRVRARAVVCPRDVDSAERCRPVTVEVAASFGGQ
jgi:hypothetical protein